MTDERFRRVTGSTYHAPGGTGPRRRRDRRRRLAVGAARCLWRLVGIVGIERHGRLRREHDRHDGPAHLPGWYGPKEFSDFAKLHPGLTVKTAVSGTTGPAATVAQIENNEGAFDLTLAGCRCLAADSAKLLAPLDVAAVPNVKLVPAPFRTAFPFGIPTDFGKTGFAYRKDLISERPTSWKELWALAKKYSGKITMIKYDSDIQGSFLKSLGYSVNTKVQSQLQAMQKQMLSFKPHLQAILETDYSKALIEGTASIAIDYDYDVAAAQAKNKNIVWVPPTEGMAAYLEGWYAFKSSKHLDAVWELMNFHLAAEELRVVHQHDRRCLRRARRREVHLQDDHRQPDAALRQAAALDASSSSTTWARSRRRYRAKLWEEFLAA